MFTWKPSSICMNSACITCNLLTGHRRLSVVRCTAVLWVLRNRSITNRVVDSHAIAILSLSEDIETILIRLNAKHSTFRVPTQRPSILTDLSIGTKSRASQKPTCGITDRHWWGMILKMAVWPKGLTSLQWSGDCARRHVGRFEKKTVGHENNCQANWPVRSNFGFQNFCFPYIYVFSPWLLSKTFWSQFP